MCTDPDIFVFRSFSPERDLDTVLDWLLETKRIVPGEEPDRKQERDSYFSAVRQIQNRKSDYCSMLMVDSSPVGYLSTFPILKRPESSWLDFCYLLPSYRGTGVSALLVKRIERIAAEGGCTEIRLNVHPENRRAVSFYRKNGWVDNRMMDYGLLNMVKKLN